MTLPTKRSALLTLRSLLSQVNPDIVDPKQLSRLRQLWADAGLGPFPEGVDVQTLLARIEEALEALRKQELEVVLPKKNRDISR